VKSKSSRLVVSCAHKTHGFDFAEVWELSEVRIALAGDSILKTKEHL
jgi:hypothetical protein